MNRKVATSILLVATFLVVSTASAQRYELTTDSQLFEGCVGGLCLCPIQFSSDLSGEMAVVDAGADQYKIRDARFEAKTIAKPIVFTGDGLYQRRDVGELREHRLQLTLRANDEEPVEYDSGWRARETESAEIAIGVAPSPDTCYGYAFSIVARPTTAAAGDSSSWATVKAEW